MKTEFPYLVDLSITNQCPLIKICSVGDVCYASPVHKTTELTSWNYFEEIANVMFNSKVLEVAIGGYSEPTTAVLHSQYYIDQVTKNPKYTGFKTTYNLADVCRVLKSKYFKVGWTTRNYQLDKLPSIDDLLQNTDSIAFSATTMVDLIMIEQCIAAVNELPHTRKIGRYNEVPTTIQIILEAMPYEDFKDLVEECTKKYHSITLLGYKDFGFGENKKPHEYGSEWIDFMQQLPLINGFGVDSQIVKVWGDELKRRKVEEYRLVAEEGSQTCFVDLQKRMMKPSSFTNIEFDLSNPNKFTQTFQRF